MVILIELPVCSHRLIKTRVVQMVANEKKKKTAFVLLSKLVSCYIGTDYNTIISYISH